MLRRPDMRNIACELSGADDDKIRRIVALMDRHNVPNEARAILDPLRPRLALLRPPRPLRFSRLLFLPFDPIVVHPRDWRWGDPSVPRAAIGPIAETVRAGLGKDLPEIDAMIAGRDTRDIATIAKAGPWLWSRAGTILDSDPTMVGWDASGLPATMFGPLTRAVGSVLRRATALRDLERATQLGTNPNEGNAIQTLLAGLGAESAEGLTMLVALLPVRLPHVTPRLQRLIGSARGSPESVAVRQAMDRGLDGVLGEMERANGFDNQVLRAPLRDAANDVRRVATLLRDIDEDPEASRHRPRLKAIWQNLDQACRKRFGEGLTEEVVVPLMAAAEPLAAAEQTRLETTARALRGLESAARKFGGAKVYDALLDKAATVARTAADSGVLTKVRHMRLVEILAGPEAAEALYRRGAG